MKIERAISPTKVRPEAKFQSKGDRAEAHGDHSGQTRDGGANEP